MQLTKMADDLKIGFEIEYNGVSLEDTAKIIQSQYGGEIKSPYNNRLVINNTEFGKFLVELDVDFIQRLDQNNEGSKSEFLNLISENAEKYFGFVAPNEIVCPPILESKIENLDKLIDILREKGAKGTGKSFLYAFGLHINKEVRDININYILSIVRSFIEKFEDLKFNLDTSRVISGFIGDYSANYKKMVMDENYNPTLEEFMKDYVEYNKTRNRALDLTPLFKHIDKNSVDEIKDNKIKARPTFHYRLPNCRIDNKNWSIKKEYSIWKEIEENAKKYRN